MSEFILEDQTFFHHFMKWWFRSQSQNLFFLLVGSKNSGKSAIADQLIGTSIATPETPVDVEECYSNVLLGTERLSLDKKNCLLDVSGLHSSSSTALNTNIVKSLQHNLCRRTIAPTVVFITERIDSARFDGMSSDYRQALETFRQIKNELSPYCCLNIILLLTHGDNPTIQDTLAEREAKFKTIFYEVFQVEAICVVIKNPTSAVKDILKQLRKSTNNSVFYNLLKDFLKKRKIEIKTKTLPLAYTKTHLELEFNTTNISTDSVIQINNPEFAQGTNQFIDNDVRVDEDRFSLKSFDDYNAKRFFEANDDDFVYNLLPARSQIRLCNKETLAVDQCNIGQRVLSSNNEVCVITNIVKFYRVPLGGKRSFRSGRITVPNSVPCNELVPALPYFPGPVRQDLRRSYSDIRYYYLEINEGEGSFFSDGYVSVSKWKRPISEPVEERSQDADLHLEDAMRENNPNDTTRNEGHQSELAIENEGSRGSNAVQRGSSRGSVSSFGTRKPSNDDPEFAPPAGFLGTPEELFKGKFDLKKDVKSEGNNSIEQQPLNQTETVEQEQQGLPSETARENSNASTSESSNNTAMTESCTEEHF